MVGRLLAGDVTWRLLCLLVFAAYNGSAANAQLLGADECLIGYQYRSPPEGLNCRANITVTRLNCWVALPTVIPAGTRVDVIWYWRSIDEAERGSNVAFQVRNSPPFQYVHTFCDREPICPTHVENLTVNVNQLEISHFGAALQGDYTCRVMLTNQTTGVMDQAMQPSACARLQLVSDQAQNCEIVGIRSAWSCADTVQQLEECPQEFSFHPTTSVVTPTSSPHMSLWDTSTTSVHTLQARTTTGTSIISSRGSPTLQPSPHLSYSTSYPSPTQSGTPTDRQSVSLSYIYISLGVSSLLLLAAIGTVISIILGVRSMRQRKVINLRHARAPTYVIGPGIKSGKVDSLNKSGTALRRDSTIYSKPTWPSEREDTPKEHNYATITGEQEGKWESGTYSYAYQHGVILAHQLTKRGNEGNGLYQEMGTIDYMHMYSKPSPLLLSSERSAGPAHSREERGYTQLSSATLDAKSVYTSTVQTPANLYQGTAD